MEERRRCKRLLGVYFKWERDRLSIGQSPRKENPPAFRAEFEAEFPPLKSDKDIVFDAEVYLKIIERMDSDMRTLVAEK